MPQRTQHFLIHILLLWTTIISIIQIVIIILFFTAGHKYLDSSAVESSKRTSKENVTLPQSLPNNGLALSQGKMLTFKATGGQSKIKWTAHRADTALISEEDEGLLMKVDGYYFLNLQVTSCGETKEHTVTLMKIWENKYKTLLEGRINTETNSTGLLSKVEEFGTGEKLVVKINPPVRINDTESVTHLDIIFMLRPQM